MIDIPMAHAQAGPHLQLSLGGLAQVRRQSFVGCPDQVKLLVALFVGSTGFNQEATMLLMRVAVSVPSCKKELIGGRIGGSMATLPSA